MIKSYIKVAGGCVKHILLCEIPKGKYYHEKPDR